MLEAFLPSVPMLIIIVAGLAGGLWIFKRSYVKQIGELQASVNATYRSLNEAQEKQIITLKDELKHLKRIVTAIQYALNRQGLRIEIDGESITLIDDQARKARTVQIRIDSDEIDAINNSKDKEQLS